MKLFICTLGLVLIIEGLPYFAFPLRVKEWLKVILQMPEARLRSIGFFLIMFGLFLVYLAQRSGLF